MKRNRGKRDKGNKIKKGQVKKANNTVQIDEEALARAIVSAYRTILEEKRKDEVAQAEKEQSEWNDILGQISYPEDEKGIVALVHKFRNDIVALGRILFMKECDVRGPRATFAIIAMLTTEFFKWYKWGLYILAAAMFITAFANENITVVGIIYGFFLWLLARIVRMATFEISKLRDGNLLLTIFSGCLSLIAVVIAIVALVVG